MIRTRWFSASILIVLIVLLGVQLFSLIYYYREQRILNAYLSQVTTASLPASEQVKQIVLSLKGRPDQGNESYFLCPIFRPLRPTPWQVLEGGGDCGDRSRVLVALLRLRGIHASKWALYDAKGDSVHAVVQADIESGKMVADPLFGLWFPKPQGGYYAIAELRKDPNLLLNRIAELRARGERPGSDRLETYPVGEYVYDNARTINWNKTGVLRFSYSVLQRLLGNEIDELPRPFLAEEPPLMVLYGTGALELFILLTWIIVRRAARTTAAATLSIGDRTNLARPNVSALRQQRP
jgi:hypothetical protein